MKLRVGNGCWHAGHVQAAMNALEAGFFAQEGLDVEIVHAKINPKGIESSRPDGERYDEVGTVLRDMIAFNIDIIPDVHVRTPFAERALGQRRSAHHRRLAQLVSGDAGDRAGDQIDSRLERQAHRRLVQGRHRDHVDRASTAPGRLDPDSDVEWKVGYQYGSMREAWKPLHAGETDAALVRNQFVPELLEKGFNKLYDFVEDTNPMAGPTASRWRANRLSSAIRN